MRLRESIRLVGNSFLETVHRESSFMLSFLIVQTIRCSMVLKCAATSISPCPRFHSLPISLFFIRSLRFVFERLF